ncbi:MAG: hypothetical protein WA970_03630 [Gammaproteobacteria bacterium]
MAEQPESGTHEPQASKSPMPFADLAKSVAALDPQRLMEQLTNIFGAYSFPGINVDTRRARNRQNVKALGAANKRGLENAEAVMIRQGEIPRQTLEEISTAFKALWNAGAPQKPSSRHKARSFDTFFCGPSTTCASLWTGPPHHAARPSRPSMSASASMQRRSRQCQSAWRNKDPIKYLTQWKDETHGDRPMNPLDSIVGTLIAGVILALILVPIAHWLAGV